MKREDAIWILELIRNRDARTDAEKDAVNAAIEALKAQLSCEGTIEGTTSDLISRQAAIDALDVLCQEHRYRIPGKRETYSEYNEAWQDALDRAEGLIFNLPPIQPEPQEGHWIRTDCGLDVECKCSRCGYKDFVQPRDEYWFKRNYCPNCGARMKGERQK